MSLIGLLVSITIYDDVAVVWLVIPNSTREGGELKMPLLVGNREVGGPVSCDF